MKRMSTTDRVSHGVQVFNLTAVKMIVDVTKDYQNIHLIIHLGDDHTTRRGKSLHEIPAKLAVLAC